MFTIKTPPLLVEIARGLKDVADGIAGIAGSAAATVRSAKQVRSAGKRAASGIRNARPRVSIDQNGIHVDLSTDDSSQGADK